MSQKTEKELVEERRKLAEKLKEIRNAKNANKEERKNARTANAVLRKELIPQLASVRDNVSGKMVFNTFSKGTSEEINKLADEVINSAAVVAESIRSFVENKNKIDGVASDEDSGDDL